MSTQTDKAVRTELEELAQEILELAAETNTATGRQSPITTGMLETLKLVYARIVCPAKIEVAGGATFHCEDRTGPHDTHWVELSGGSTRITWTKSGKISAEQGEQDAGTDD